MPRFVGWNILDSKEALNIYIYAQLFFHLSNNSLLRRFARIQAASWYGKPVIDAAFAILPGSSNKQEPTVL